MAVRNHGHGAPRALIILSPSFLPKFALAFLFHTVTEILVDRFEGKRLNSPNDVVVKRDGSIWFTDPPYGILSNHEGFAAESEIGACFVYRFDPESRALSVVVQSMVHPNGLAFSPDESVLYVADTSAAVIENVRSAAILVAR